MYSEQSFVDSITVLPDGQIEVRRVDIVLKNGVAISKTYHRHVLTMGDSLVGEDSRVIAIAEVTWGL